MLKQIVSTRQFVRKEYVGHDQHVCNMLALTVRINIAISLFRTVFSNGERLTNSEMLVKILLTVILIYLRYFPGKLIVFDLKMCKKIIFLNIQ